MQGKISSLQSLCLKKIRQSIIKGEAMYAKRIHLCPVEFHENLLSLCNPKQLKLAEKYSERSKVDLNLSPFWKVLCKREFRCDKKAPDITWSIKYELLEAERKRVQEERAKAISDKYDKIEEEGKKALAKIVKGGSATSHSKKRSTATIGQYNAYVLPSGRVYMYKGRF